MSCSLFLRIVFEVKEKELYFVQRRNCAKRIKLSSLQKMTVAMRMLAYVTTADLGDEYVRIDESTTMLSLKKIVKMVLSINSEKYLR